MMDVEVFTKYMWDRRGIRELFADLLSLRSNPGDLVRLKVIWHSTNKPRFLVEFNPQDGIKKAGWVDITDYLPESYGKKNPTSGVWQGFSSWKDFMLHSTDGCAVYLEGMTRRSGRKVLVTEEAV